MEETIKLKGILAEDFVQYKKPSMFLITTTCDWKCCIDGNFSIGVCQNQEIAQRETKDFSCYSIYKFYISNPITKSIVIGGLEPMLQFKEVENLIKTFRNNCCLDDFVIYTGYYHSEIKDKILVLKQYKNIIIKYGRYIPNQEPHYDDVLGINLASNNQYAERI